MRVLRAYFTEANHVKINVDSTANDESTTLAENLSEKFLASVWAKQYVLFGILEQHFFCKMNCRITLCNMSSVTCQVSGVDVG